MIKNYKSKAGNKLGVMPTTKKISYNMPIANFFSSFLFQVFSWNSQRVMNENVGGSFHESYFLLKKSNLKKRMKGGKN